MSANDKVEQLLELLSQVEDKAKAVSGDAAHKDAQVASYSAEVKYLKHKVTRLEEWSKKLRAQLADELSHHARYNAVRAEVKEFLNEEKRDKLLVQTRERAKKVLVTLVKEQDALCAEFDKAEKEMDKGHEKKMQKLRDEIKEAARVAVAHVRQPSGKASSPIGKTDKNGKAKGKKGDKGEKKKMITVPRARFIRDITPQYNEEKAKAVAAGKEFPPLFTYVKKPWDEMDPAEKKRKYEDPYEAEKKQRAQEEGEEGATKKKSKKEPKAAAKKDDDDDASGSESAGDDSANEESGGEEGNASDSEEEGEDGNDSEEDKNSDDDGEGKEEEEEDEDKKVPGDSDGEGGNDSD